MHETAPSDSDFFRLDPYSNANSNSNSNRSVFGPAGSRKFPPTFTVKAKKTGSFVDNVSVATRPAKKSVVYYNKIMRHYKCIATREC